MTGHPSMCRIDDSGPAMVQLAMGWVAADAYRPARRTPSADAGYVCGKKKHDAAVARRRKRKKGGPK